jgi:hypothetical protein
VTLRAWLARWRLRWYVRTWKLRVRWSVWREIGREMDRREHEDEQRILYGDPDAPEPKGLLRAKDLQR